MLRYPVFRKVNAQQALACSVVVRNFRQKCPCGGLQCQSMD
jgi:hypothetical protein